jgi:hypothetical protein
MTIARLRPPGLSRATRAAGALFGGRLSDQENAMDNSHVAALQAKHQGLERRLHDELNRPAPDEAIVQTLKKQKLLLKEEIAGVH